MKRCIKKAVGKSIVNFVELQTLINEIKLILNNRPICDDYDDDCEDVLTPNHLLYGRRLECSSLGSEEVIMDDSEFKGRRRTIFGSVGVKNICHLYVRV